MGIERGMGTERGMQSACLDFFLGIEFVDVLIIEVTPLGYSVDIIRYHFWWVSLSQYFIILHKDMHCHIYYLLTVCLF